MQYQEKFKVRIDGIEYLLGYPNVGQQLEIESLKNILSAGNYADYARSGNKTALQLLDLIDAVSYFYVLIPELKEKIDIKSFANIDPLFQKKLSKAFVKYYNEFIVKIDDEINKVLNNEDDDKEGEE